MTPGRGAKRFDLKEAAANAVWRLMAGFSFAQFRHGPHQAVIRTTGNRHHQNHQQQGR